MLNNVVVWVSSRVRSNIIPQDHANINSGIVLHEPKLPFFPPEKKPFTCLNLDEKEAPKTSEKRSGSNTNSSRQDYSDSGPIYACMRMTFS
jgi:hypothetical protein